MDWIRVEAKTVADAITEASIQLGTSSDNIEYHVIEQGSAGFLGLFGGKKAVIEAKKKKTDEDLMKEVFGDMSGSLKSENKKEPRRETRKEPKKEVKKEPRSFSEKKENAAASVKNAGSEGKKEPVKEEKASQGEKAAKETPVKEEPKEASRQGNREKEAPRNPRNGRSRNRRQRENDNVSPRKKEVPAEEKKQAAAENIPVKKTEEKAPRVPREPADPEVAKNRAETFLNSVFQTMGMDVKIETVFEEDSLSVNIMGDEMGILIGKRGQTLDSLQYLTSLVVNKGNAAYVRVKLDTENYRDRRKATLENLAKNIALKVKKTRRPVFLEPMNPYERRIIHSALQNDPYVTTHSEGEEPCRKVVVTLKKGNERNSK